MGVENFSFWIPLRTRASSPKLSKVKLGFEMAVEGTSSGTSSSLSLRFMIVCYSAANFQFVLVTDLRLLEFLRRNANDAKMVSQPGNRHTSTEDSAATLKLNLGSVSCK